MRKPTYHLRHASNAFIALAFVAIGASSVHHFWVLEQPLELSFFAGLAAPTMIPVFIGMGLRRGERWARWLGLRLSFGLLVGGFGSGVVELFAAREDWLQWLVASVVMVTVGGFVTWKLTAFSIDERRQRREAAASQRPPEPRSN